MRYSKHFKSGQKILLKVIPDGGGNGRFEALTVYYEEASSRGVRTKLPYRLNLEEDFPFQPGTLFELLSETYGLGLRAICKLLGTEGENAILLEPQGELEVFQRRFGLRADTEVGLRYTKGEGSLRQLRQQWEKNVAVLQSGRDLSKLQAFPRCSVNLSSGGIRFHVRPPMENADFCLLLLDLGDGHPPICALAEVVWTGEAGEQNLLAAGMQFLNILDRDKKRLDSFVKNHASAKPAKEEEK